MKNETLWIKLKEFSVDDGSASLSFLKRLARDNGWTDRYAQQVFNEYLRFIYLICISNKPCTPSDEVDQAWHLHLAYSHSYWMDMCQELLNTRIHHGPTKGGNNEKKRYRDAYAETLALYASEFGHKPPGSIWPSVNDRFKNVENFQRLNTADFFLIRKRTLYSMIIGVAALATAPAAHAEWSFFEAVLASLAIVVGLPALLICLLWIGNRVRKNGKGCSGASGCSGCSGCGGCGG